MPEEIRRRNSADSTRLAYLRAIGKFAGYFHRSRGQLNPEHALASCIAANAMQDAPSQAQRS